MLSGLWACQTEPQPILGTWKMIRLEVADQPPIFDQALNTDITFHKDKTYVLEVNGEPEHGKWRIKDSTLYLAKETMNYEETPFKIEKLTENDLVYISEGIQTSKVTLLKMNEF
jgi:hypothetical protein